MKLFEEEKVENERNLNAVNPHNLLSDCLNPSVYSGLFRKITLVSHIIPPKRLLAHLHLKIRNKAEQK